MVIYFQYLCFRKPRIQKLRKMNKALVIIDIQNDITKNYKEIIDNINQSIDWAVNNNIHVVITGADAIACVKSTCFNLRKANYGVHVLSDCITSYDKRKIDEMLQYYASKGCEIIRLGDLPG